MLMAVSIGKVEEKRQEELKDKNFSLLLSDVQYKIVKSGEDALTSIDTTFSVFSQPDEALKVVSILSSARN